MKNGGREKGASAARRMYQAVESASSIPRNKYQHQQRSRNTSFFPPEQGFDDG